MTEREEIFLELTEQCLEEKSDLDKAFIEFLVDKIDGYQDNTYLYEEETCNYNSFLLDIEECVDLDHSNLRTITIIFKEIANSYISIDSDTFLDFDVNGKRRDFKLISKGYAEGYKEDVLGRRIDESLDMSSQWLEEYIDKEKFYSEYSVEEVLGEEGREVYETENFYVLELY